MPASRSTSRQRSASSSPRRIPVMARMCHSGVQLAVLARPAQERGELRGRPWVHLRCPGLLGGRRVRPAGRVAGSSPASTASPQRGGDDRVDVPDGPGATGPGLPCGRPGRCLKLAVERVQPGGGEAGQRDGADVRRDVQPDVLPVAGDGAVGQPSPSSQRGQVAAEQLFRGLRVAAPGAGEQRLAQASQCGLLGREPALDLGPGGAVRPGDNSLPVPAPPGFGLVAIRAAFVRRAPPSACDELTSFPASGPVRFTYRRCRGDAGAAVRGDAAAAGRVSAAAVAGRGGGRAGPGRGRDRGRGDGRGRGHGAARPCRGGGTQIPAPGRSRRPGGGRKRARPVTAS